MALGTPQVGGGGSGTNGNPLTTLVPGSSGDLMIVVIGWRGSTTTMTDNAGQFTELTGSPWSSGTDRELRVFTRLSDGVVDSVAFTKTGGGTGQSFLIQGMTISGADPTTPINVIGTASANASAQNIGPITGLTPTTAGSGVLVVGFKADDWTSVATLSGDGLTWSELTELDTTSGNDAGLVIDWATGWTSGALTSKTFTVTGGAANTGLGIMFAVQPVAAGGTTVTVDTAGAVTLAGQTVNIPVTERRTISTPGAITLAGQTVNTTVAQTLTVTPGAVALAGQSVNLRLTETRTVTPGAVTFTGQTVGALVNTRMQVGPGAVTLTGQTVNTTIAVTVQVSPGAIVLAGANVPSTLTMPVTPGAVTLAGQTVTTRIAQVLPVTPGAVTLTGQSVNLPQTLRSTVVPGAIVLAGQTVGAGTVVTLPVTPGAVTLLGQSVLLQLAQAVSPGAIVLAGADVTLVSTGAIGPEIVSFVGPRSGGAPAGTVEIIAGPPLAGGSPSGTVEVLQRVGALAGGAPSGTVEAPSTDGPTAGGAAAGDVEIVSERGI